MPALIIPEATHGDTMRPIIYQAYDKRTLQLALWASGTIRIIGPGGKAVINTLAMTVSTPVADALLWYPVYGNATDGTQIPHPSGEYTEYIVQIRGVVLDAASDRNVQRSVERTWRVKRAV